MSISNYSELLTAVSSTWPRRSDLTSMAADFITLGEARLNRLLRVREMEESATVTPSQSVSYVSLPTGFMEPISFTDDQGDELQAVAPDVLAKMSANSSTGRPQYYRVSSRIDFERVADGAYSFTMRYYKKLDIAADLTNAVLTAAPDIYLFAALVNAERYVKNDNRIMVWKAELSEAIREWNHRNLRNLATLRTDLPLQVRSNILQDE